MKSWLHRTGWLLTGLFLTGAVIFSVLAILTGSKAEIVVEWSTASEMDTVGYNLYRSESATSPFVKINTSLIPASPDPQTGGSYSYNDPDVLPGKNYFYELEAVSETGANERHGPIIAQAQSIFPAAWPLAGVLFVVAVITTVAKLKLKNTSR